jgi:hypothetical protein
MSDNETDNNDDPNDAPCSWAEAMDGISVSFIKLETTIEKLAFFTDWFQVNCPEEFNLALGEWSKRAPDAW